MKFIVTFNKVLSSSVTVDVPADADEDAIATAAERAFDAPSICVQCAGWGRGWGVEDGEWEIPDEAWAIQKAEAGEPAK